MKRDTDPLVDCAWGASLSYALPIGLVPLVPMTHSLADRATDAALAYLAGLPGLFFLSLWSCHGTLSGIHTEFPVYLILEIKSRNQVSRLSSFISLGCANNINKGICYQIEWILTYFTRCDNPFILYWTSQTRGSRPRVCSYPSGQARGIRLRARYLSLNPYKDRRDHPILLLIITKVRVLLRTWFYRYKELSDPVLPSLASETPQFLIQERSLTC